MKKNIMQINKTNDEKITRWQKERLRLIGIPYSNEWTRTKASIVIKKCIGYQDKSYQRTIIPNLTFLGLSSK